MLSLNPYVNLTDEAVALETEFGPGIDDILPETITKAAEQTGVQPKTPVSGGPIPRPTPEQVVIEVIKPVFQKLAPDQQKHYRLIPWPIDRLIPTEERSRKVIDASLITALNNGEAIVPGLATADGFILDGHHRFYAAQDLGKTHIWMCTVVKSKATPERLREKAKKTAESNAKFGQRLIVDLKKDFTTSTGQPSTPLPSTGLQGYNLGPVRTHQPMPTIMGSKKKKKRNKKNAHDPELVKGDVAGHDFHGNQWTGGQGAGQLETSIRGTRTQNQGIPTRRQKEYTMEELTALRDRVLHLQEMEGKPLTPDGEAKVRAYEAKLTDRTTEKGAAFDANGEVILEKSGGRASVSYNGAELSLMNRCAVFTHNHPEETSMGVSSPFSPADIETARAVNAGEMRAVTDKWDYSMKPAPQPKDFFTDPTRPTPYGPPGSSTNPIWNGWMSPNKDLLSRFSAADKEIYDKHGGARFYRITQGVTQWAMPPVSGDEYRAVAEERSEAIHKAWADWAAVNNMTYTRVPHGQ